MQVSTCRILNTHLDKVISDSVRDDIFVTSYFMNRHQVLKIPLSSMSLDSIWPNIQEQESIILHQHTKTSLCYIYKKRLR